MGYKIGVPSLKLNNVGKTSKHCGSFGAVTREALEEREGHDIDIDYTKSKDNVITGYRTAEELMEYSRQHCEKLRDKSGRKLRADAVVMCGTIFKPPAVFINALSEEARKKFFDDCEEYFAGVVGKENIKSTVLHKDERAEHLHIFWEPMTADGRLCAKEVHNLKFFSEINHNFPAFMRERGWDIDDCECYDYAQENYEKELKKTQEQLEAEYQRQHKNGLSSMEYKKQAEEKKRELVSEIDEKKAEKNEVIKELYSVKAELELSEMEASNLENKINKAKEEAAEKIADLNKQIAERSSTLQSVIKTNEEYEQTIAKTEHDILGLEEYIKINKDLENEIFSGAMDSASIIHTHTKKLKNWYDEFRIDPLELLRKIKENIYNLQVFERVQNISNKVSDALKNILTNALERSEQHNSKLVYDKTKDNSNPDSDSWGEK